MVKPQVGQLVTSTAGRDAGAAYIVLRYLDDTYVLVVDGDKRPMANAKRKNLRHLELHNRVAVQLQSRLRSGESVADAQVQTALRELTTKSEEVD